MMKSSLWDQRSGHALTSSDIWKDETRVDTEEQILVVAPATSIHGSFTSATRSTAGTTILTTPETAGSVWLTDLIVNGEKQASGSVEVTFTDGSNTVQIFKAFVVDAPANVAISFSGRWQGWRDARIEMVVTGSTDSVVSIGYTKIPNGLPFGEWDALR